MVNSKFFPSICEVQQPKYPFVPELVRSARRPSRHSCPAPKVTTGSHTLLETSNLTPYNYADDYRDPVFYSYYLQYLPVNSSIKSQCAPKQVPYEIHILAAVSPSICSQ